MRYLVSALFGQTMHYLLNALFGQTMRYSVNALFDHTMRYLVIALFGLTMRDLVNALFGFIMQSLLRQITIWPCLYAAHLQRDPASKRPNYHVIQFPRSPITTCSSFCASQLSGDPVSARLSYDFF